LKTIAGIPMCCASKGQPCPFPWLGQPTGMGSQPGAEVLLVLEGVTEAGEVERGCLVEKV